MHVDAYIAWPYDKLMCTVEYQEVDKPLRDFNNRAVVFESRDIIVEPEAGEGKTIT